MLPVEVGELCLRVGGGTTDNSDRVSSAVGAVRCSRASLGFQSYILNKFIATGSLLSSRVELH